MCEYLGSLDVMGISFLLEGKGFSEAIVKAFSGKYDLIPVLKLQV